MEMTGQIYSKMYKEVITENTREALNFVWFMCFIFKQRIILLFVKKQKKASQHPSKIGIYVLIISNK